MKKIYRIIVLFVMATLFANAQVTVNGGPTLTYTSLNTAFAAINAGTHFGAITIDITGNTIEGVTGYAPTPLLASGQSLANYSSIVIRPTVQATVSGSPATGRGVIELDGADNVTINGDIVAGPIQKDLTFNHTGLNSLAATAVIRFIGRTTLGLGATNNTVTNCVIIGNTEGNDGISGSTVVNSYGIYFGSNVASLATGGLGDNYDNNVISNNEIKKAYFGIWLGGTTANPADNNLISGNTIGSNTAGETVSFGGISLSSVVTSTITQNEIFNLKLNTSVNNYGIQIAGSSSSSVTISRNRIHGIHSLSTNGYGAYGINLTAGNGHLVVNNVIYDIMTVDYTLSTTFNPFGIRITSGTGIGVYYNSVNIFGTTPAAWASSTSVASAAFLVTSTAVTGLDVRNNIFNNIQTTTNTAVTSKRYMAVWFPASYNFANATLNNNAYNVSNDADHYVGKVGTTLNVTEGINLGAWQALSQVNNASNDVNSGPIFNFPAPFTSNTNLTFAANTNYVAESGAVLIPALGTNIDYNANVRPLAGINPNTAPDMGAYEFDGINGFATDAGISNLLSPATNGCYTSAENVITVISNYGTSAISNIPVTVIVSGPINQTLTGTYAGPIAAGGTFNYTLTPTINMLGAGVYNFKAFTSLSGDMQNLNDTLANVTRTVVGVSTLPQFVDFSGFTGANLPTFFPDWREGQGVAATGTISNWTSQTNLNSAGNVNARILLQTTTANEWIVGPKILATANTNISFDASITGNTAAPFTTDIMGSDDKVMVMVSTDCGVSYTPIFTITAANNLGINFTNFNVNLSAYAGQEIIVGFKATDGPVDDIESYYFHLDNINLYNASPTDAGVSAIVTPSTGCFTNNEQVVVTVNNFGTAAISNFPVTVWVSGPLAQTVTATYTAILAPSATDNFTLGVINLAAAGNYTLKGFTSLAGDLNNINDSNTVVKTTLPLGTIPQFVSFTGFTGANLPTFFPDWREGQGAAATGTTSSWTSQTNLNSAGNVNARVLLSATTANEWIVGPKFLATANSNVSFDASITGNTAAPFTVDSMGVDDKVMVMVSTDCGVSYTPIFTITETNNLGIAFTNFNVSLSAYAGQEIIVGFKATDGPIDDIESYYFHLDNINLYNTAAADGGVSAILSPTVNACLSTTEQIVVTVNNYGFNPLTNFPVTAVISGPINSTITSNYTGTLAPSTSDTFTIGVANMNLSGSYTINAFTGVSGDPNAFNDATVLTTTQTPNFGIAGLNEICGSGSTTLSVTGSASTYTWSNSSNSSSIIVSPSVTTTYSAAATGGTNNCQVSAFFTVTVTNPTISAQGAAVCGTTAVGTLSANAFAPVNWFASPTSTVVLATGNTFTTTAPVTTTFYAEANSLTSASIATTFSAGNGCAGNMFDLTPTSGNIIVDSLDLHIGSTTTETVYLFYKAGTYVGNETNAAAWIAWDTLVVTGAGAGFPTKVVPSQLTLNNNVVYGIYVSLASNNLDYSNATVTYSNSDVSLQLGAGICTSLFASPIASRTWNGNIYYSKQGCTSPKIPVTLTVNPTPTLAINASTTTICSGNSVTLTANGVDTYTWSTTSNSTTIVETPSVTTSYTVNGTSIACSTTETATVTINVNATPSVSLTAGASTICAMNGSISLTGSPAGGVYSGASVTGSLLSIANPGTFVPIYSYTNSLNGCSNSASTTVIVANCTSIDNNGAITSSTISVYPNPNNGSFTIETGNELSKEVSILDLTGRVVFSEITEAKKIQLNIENLAKGMYHVIVKTELGSDIIKVIKQ